MTDCSKKVLKNEELYLTWATEIDEEALAKTGTSPQYHSKLSELYRKLSSTTRNYFVDQMMAFPSSQTKIDPYIAGGIADALAGPGAGLYTALRTEQRNREIDAQREKEKQYKSKAIDDSYSMSSIAEEIECIIDGDLFQEKKAITLNEREKYYKKYPHMEEKRYVLHVHENYQKQTKEVKRNLLVIGILFVIAAIILLPMIKNGYSSFGLYLGIALLTMSVIIFCITVPGFSYIYEYFRDFRERYNLVKSTPNFRWEDCDLS